jgi:HK97 family phage major capsid protein/HK97 family phage prohead protease
MEKRHLFTGELRAVGTTIVGTIPYNSPSLDLGGFVETLVPGAFTRAIGSKNIIALVSHDHKKPLANSNAGTLKFIDGPKELTVRMQLDPEISHHRDTLASVRRGDFTGLSFGFRIDKGGERWSERDNQRVRELVNVDLKEVSPVVFPAYPSTSIAVRSKYSTTKGSNKMNKNEIMTERKKVLDRMRELDDAPENSETRSEYSRLDAEFERLSGDIDKIKRRETLDQREVMLSQSQRSPIKPTPERAERREEPESFGEKREMEYFQRALSMDGGSGDQAGYLISPTMMGKIITKAKDDTPIIAACDTMMVEKAASIMLPTLESDPADPTWTSELRIGAEDTEMGFQGRALSPHPLAQYIKISKKLIEASVDNVNALVEDRMGYKFSLVQENGICNGTGANQMLGVFVNSTHGLGTDRDCSTHNTATQVKADNLIEMIYTLKAGYLRNSIWAWHRDAIRQIRQLKTGDGQYLLSVGLTENAPDKIIGRPLMISEFVPHTFTSGQYVGILGDWKYYKIAVAKNTTFEILRELFALSNQIAVVARAELDGMPSISEAFVRCKMG